MTLSDHLSLADVKNRLSEVVDTVEREQSRVVITKHGRPSAVLLSIEDLESLEETLAVLSDPSLVRDLRAADADVRAGRVELLSEAEARERISRS